MVSYDLVAWDISSWLRSLPQAETTNRYTVSSQTQDNVYDLYAVVNHDENKSTGNFSAMIWRDDTWCIYNDEEVSALEEDYEKAVITQKSYILFYKRRNMSNSALIFSD